MRIAALAIALCGFCQPEVVDVETTNIGGDRWLITGEVLPHEGPDTEVTFWWACVEEDTINTDSGGSFAFLLSGDDGDTVEIQAETPGGGLSVIYVATLEDPGMP